MQSAVLQMPLITLLSRKRRLALFLMIQECQYFLRLAQSAVRASQRCDGTKSLSHMHQ